MPLAFAPRAGLAGLIAELESLGMTIVQVGEVSPNPAGVFPVSNGAGGWLASKLFENGGNDLGSDGYSSFSFVAPDLAGTALFSGFGTVLFDSPAGGATRFRVRNSSTDILVLGTSARTSLATDRLLRWNGTANDYVDPSAALYAAFALPGAASITAASINLRHNTWASTNAGAAYTVSLPAASTVSDGRRVTFKDGNGRAAVANITIDADGTDLIDGAGNVVLTVNYSSVTLQKAPGANNWMIVERV